LAESYQFVESVDSFIAEQQSRRARRTQ
jgi:hypothetical protein